MKYKIKNICCIGAGYVGGPTMAVIADKCKSIQVQVVDVNKERIEQWNNKNLNNLPIYEPGLADVVKRCRGKNLHFSHLIKENIQKADMIFISVNTPTKTKGIGAGKASDLKWVEKCAREVAKYSTGHTIVIEKSTLPVRTAEVIKSILSSCQNKSQNNNYNSSERSKSSTFDVLSNPEFLSEGTAVNDLENPERILIGGENIDAIKSLSNIYEKWVPKEKILFTNVWSSELAKLTANAFLAQRISSINSISALCEATGADIREVSRAIGSDSRIGSKFLDSGPGFGGSCFKKDILNLVYLSEYFGLIEVAEFWNGVVKMNTWHQHRISKLITKKLFGTLSGKRIAILGFAFKSNTNDTRESAAIQICKDLLEEGAILDIHDPKVNQSQISKELKLDAANIIEGDKISSKYPSQEGSWNKVKNLMDTFTNVDAVVILTEWEIYSKINWAEASKRIRLPAWVFDSRSIVNPEAVKENGFNLWRVGDGLI